MSVGKAATTATLGQDGNMQPFVGGQSAAGDTITQKMIPDGTDPELGAAVVEVTNLAAPTSLSQGTKALSTSAAALVATSTPCKYVEVTNPSSNSITVYTGGTGVTAANGRELLPGDSVTYEIDDVEKVFAIAASGTPSVRFQYLA